MTDAFDFIVIGGGSAGYAGASTAARLGLKVAVIEGGADVGGLCILRGCMPSKTLLESGHRAEAIRAAGEFGLRAEYLGADGAERTAEQRHVKPKSVARTIAIVTRALPRMRLFMRRRSHQPSRKRRVTA